MTRKRLLFIVLLFAALTLFAGVTVAVVASQNESVGRRLAALPHYARSYVRRWRPTVLPPTPPPADGEARDRLLRSLTVTPTLAPTFTSLPSFSAATPTAGASLTPSATPSPTPSPTPSATPFPMTPVATSVTLTGVNHAAQTWNNCGPTTIAMNLSYFGLNMHQREAAAFLKPNADDKNVSPEQLAAFAEGEGYKVRIGVGGDLSLLRRLLSNGFPVIVETWILPEDLGGMGHYRLLTGFDDVAQTFTAQDSYFGPDEVIGARALDEEWRVFNRKYLVLYRPEQEEFLMGVLGAAGDDEQMLAVTLAEAQRAAAANPQDAFAWFNLGSAYTWTGEFETAATAFDEARRLGLPLRMFWYQFELFDAYMAVGRFEEVAQLAYATAYSASGHEEAYYYQGMAYRALGREDVAVSNLRKAVDYNPNFEPAIAALGE